MTSKRKIYLAALAAIGGFTGFAGRANAGTFTWDGGGADDNVSTAANWSTDVAPKFNYGTGTVADDLIFAGTTRLTPVVNVNAGEFAYSITFDATAGAFNIGGTNTVALGTTVTSGGNITNNSTATQTFSTLVAPRAGTTTAANGDIVFAGGFSPGNGAAVNARTNFFSGDHNIYMTGKVTGFGRITRQGNGTLFITNDTNDYQGETRIENGAVRVSVANALGATSQGTRIAGNTGNAGRLELVGGITFAPEGITLEARQGASVNAPHIVNVSDNNTWTGNMGLTTGGSDYLITSEGGNLLITGNISSNLTGTRNLRFGGASTGEVSGGILNTGSGAGMNVIKEGTGTWTLSGSNTFAGNLAVNGGTLVVSGFNSTPAPVAVNAGTLKLTSTGYIGSSPSITVAQNANFDVTDYNASGGYVVSSATTLTGAGHVKGLTNVGGGAALAGGNIVTPATLTFENGLSLTGGGTTNAYFTDAGHSLIDVTGGTLSATGSNDIKVSGFGFGTGQYALFKYTGTLGGDGFSAFNLAQAPTRATATLVNNTAAHTIDLNVTAVDFPKWTGAVSQDWDINTTQNWKEITSGNVTTYLQPGTIGDAVIFDDSATDTTVNLTTTLAPANVMVGNSQKDYAFTGFGNITGVTSLIKSGSKTLVLGNMGINDYTGGTFIKGGTLQVGDSLTGSGGDLGSGPVVNNGALVFNRNDFVVFSNVMSGTGSTTLTGLGTVRLAGLNSNYDGTITVANGVLSSSGGASFGTTNGATVVLPGGTLDVNANQLGKEAIFAAGDGFGGQGAIVNLATNQNNALENVTLTGDTTFGGTARWDIRNLGNLTQLSTTGHAYNITKIGTNQVSLVDVTVDPALGDVNVNEGLFSVEHLTTGLGDPTKTVTVNGGASFQLWALDKPLDKKIVSNGGTIIGGSGTTNALAGTINLAADTLFRVNSGVTLTASNVISGTGVLNKDTAGTLVLANTANTYQGATNINGGTVVVSSLANGGAPSSIGQSSSVAGNLTIGSAGATLRFNGTTASATDRLMTLGGNTTIDASGATGATLSFTNPGALVVSNSSTSAASLTLTLTGANTGDNVLAPTLADAVDGGAGFGVPVKLTKTGHGTWVLPSANTFTGDVSVTGGVLKVRNGNALGAVGNTVSVVDATANANPASVVFDNPAGVTVANNFKTSGGGGGGQDPDGPGVLHVAAGTTTLSGTLTNTSGGGYSTYTADAGATLNITGTITNDTARTLYVGGAGTGNISGVIQNGTGTQGIEKRGAGTWNITGTSNTYTGATTVAAGVLNVSGSVASSSGVTVNGGAYQASNAQVVKALTVNGGVAAVTAPKAALTVGDGTSATNPITITGGSVDLQGNGLVVRYAPGNDQAVLQSVRGQIVAAYNAGGASWQGSGIGSSTAAGNSSGAVGYALATEVLPFADEASDTFMGSPVDTSSVVARYTLGGDATLDGKVDFNDLVKLAQNYNAKVSDTSDSWWNKGDFTYDGTVDFNDLVKLAQNYNSALPTEPIPGATAVFEADLAKAFASVPEPGTISILGIAGVALMGRRRRRNA